MKINGYINADQEEKALMETVKFTSNRTDIKAPHFVMYVREYLEDLYGKELVEQGGLTVKTTLDYQIQMLAEKVVADEITRLTPLNVTNASVVVVDPVTGEILAMVGSKDYFDIENDGNVNVALRERQSGSSIKVVNYAYALSHGYSPLTMIDDSPITFNFPGSEPYSPKNYDGTYSGKITLRNALAQSRNIPAVKVLASYGVDKMIELGKDMGITTWNEPTRYGLSITLGGAETKLIDLATVYSTLANYGVKPELTPLASVTDHKGNTYYTNSCKKEETTTKIQYALDLVSNIANADENKVAINTINHNCLGTQVLDSRVAYMLTDILKDNYARAPQFGLLSSLVIYNHPEVAVKTGTSNNLKDNLTIGYNQDYVVAVWVGNNDGSQMARVASGVTGASPIWNKIMTQLLAFSKSKDWEIPQGMAKIFICPTTGTLSCTGCANREEWFFAENVPTSRCSAEQIQALNTQE